jgi:hypothetical protein
VHSDVHTSASAGGGDRPRNALNFDRELRVRETEALTVLALPKERQTGGGALHLIIQERIQRPIERIGPRRTDALPDDSCRLSAPEQGDSGAFSLRINQIAAQHTRKVDAKLPDQPAWMYLSAVEQG